jgi:hypothetical protein
LAGIIFPGIQLVKNPLSLTNMATLGGNSGILKAQMGNRPGLKSPRPCIRLKRLKKNYGAVKLNFA